MSQERAAPAWLPVAARAVVKVGPGEHYVTDAADTAILTTLGSCVAACIRDPEAAVGGLNHFMLPRSDDGVWGKAAASLRYGNFAMERLISDVLARGGCRSRLEVKLFGGAQRAPYRAAIGPRNADYVEGYLQAEGMTPVVSLLRGPHARRVVYLPVTGRAFVQELPEESARIAAADIRFGRILPQRFSSGAVELFERTERT